MNLINPSVEYKDDFLNMVEEYLSAREEYYFEGYDSNRFIDYINNLDEISKGINLPKDMVPMHYFWLIDNNRLIGESRLRINLTPKLENEGGNIGYKIRPKQRRKGYGTKILALTLEKAREIGLDRVLITCDADNIGSTKIIEKNGGILKGKAISDESGKEILLYWITLL